MIPHARWTYPNKKPAGRVVVAKRTIELSLLDMARDEGAEYPTFAESTGTEPVITDTASGRTWKVELKEF
jgi:hypothetical protein